MLTLTDIKALMNKYNINASKRFGQNFLIDENILNNIIKTADIKGKEVIEIGPGLGSLTVFLLDNASHVDAYEIDTNIINVLQNERDEANFTLHPEDFLKANLEFSNTKTVVANIPYNITSDILFKLFKESNKFDTATLMMQKEVADRLSARPKTKAYGKLTVTANHFANIEKAFDVPPTSFIPAPKVTSSVVKLTFKKDIPEDSVEFMKFIKGCFAQQRKTLNNNLKTFLDADKAKEILVAFCEETKLPENVRPQQVTIEQFDMLFLQYKAKK